MAMNFAEQMGVPNWEFRLVFGRTRIEYDPKRTKRTEESIISRWRALSACSSG
jgi:hypothetical protein